MIKYQQEFLCSVKGDIKPLLEYHYSEVHPLKDIMTFDIDWEAYENLEVSDLLRIFTARDGDRLVGYLAMLVVPNFHCKGQYTAQDDALFVCPSVRGSSVCKHLIEFMEKCLFQDGVKVVHISGTASNPIDGLMDRLGYSPIETKFQKVL